MSCDGQKIKVGYNRNEAWSYSDTYILYFILFELTSELLLNRFVELFDIFRILTTC